MLFSDDKLTRRYFYCIMFIVQVLSVSLADSLQFCSFIPNLSQPGDSEVTFSLFKSSWHLYYLTTQM